MRDGYPRNGGAKPGVPGGHAIIGGMIVPFAGNVSMDLITLDITDLAGGKRQAWRSRNLYRRMAWISTALAHPRKPRATKSRSISVAL